MLRRRILATLLAAPLALALSPLAGCSKPASPVSYIGTDLTGAPYGKDFRLADPDGRERTLADFRGRYVMLFFGFTQCPDVCPTALSRAVSVRELLGADKDKLQVIFVTLDPERDTPEVLQQYTTTFDPGFLGLRADAAGTDKVVAEFKVYYRKVPTGQSYTLDHTATTYLFDTQGRLRLALAHHLTPEQIVTDLRTLMSTGA